MKDLIQSVEFIWSVVVTVVGAGVALIVWLVKGEGKVTANTIQIESEVARLERKMEKHDRHIRELFEKQQSASIDIAQIKILQEGMSQRLDEGFLRSASDRREMKSDLEAHFNQMMDLLKTKS